MSQFKDKLIKAGNYFRDESVPMHIRVGILVVISLILTFPFWVNLGKSNKNSLITSDSFPTGISGFAEDSKKEDLAQAALVEYEEKTKQPKKASISSKETSEEAQRENLEEKNTKEKEPKQEEPNTKEKLKEGTKQNKNIGAFKAFPIHMLHPRAIKEGPDKSIWVADKGGIYSFKEGKLSKGKLILNSDIYDKEFNSDLPSLSNIHPAKDGSLWAGFNDGTLMRYHRYEWKHVRGKNRSSENAITSFAEDEKNMFIGSKALYKWEEEQLLSNPNFRGKWVNNLSFKKGFGLLLAAGTKLLKYNNGSWELLFKASKEDKTINVISYDKETILIGTWSGIIRLSKKGVILDRMLSKENIKSINPSTDNTLWVGTKGEGLRYFDGDTWYKAKKEQGLGDWATELFIDRNNVIWLGVTGSGLFLAKEQSAIKWISQFPDVSNQNEPLVFRNACQAAKSLLKGVNFSNQISTTHIDDTQYVFFKGNQVCPKGKGFYRNDDSLVLLDGWRIITLKDNKRTEITIEKDYPADKINSIYYDSADSIWISTEEKGLSRYKEEEGEKKWEHLGLLKDNPVSVMLEDEDQKLWLATSPHYSKENKTYNAKNLYTFSDTSWQSFDSQNGLAQNSSLSMDISSTGQIAIGTRLGVSLINKDKEIINYSKNIDLEKKHIEDLSIDKKGRIWLVHQYYSKGISWIEDNKVYSLEKDLFNTKISKIALDRASRVWLLASNGQVGIYPKSYLYKKASLRTFDKKALRSRKLDRKE